MFNLKLNKLVRNDALTDRLACYYHDYGLTNMGHFHSLGVVDRGSETLLQVGENQIIKFSVLKWLVFHSNDWS